MIDWLKSIKQKQTKTTSFLSLGIATISLSLAAIFIKLSEREISPNALAFHRFWISTIIFALWNQFNSLGQKKPDEQSQECESPTSYPLLLLFGVGVSTSISLYCWVWSLTWSGAANATLLRNFTPVFTILGGWLLFGRQFDRQFLMGSAIAIGGAIGIGLNDWQISVNTLQGDALALLCAVFYSGTLLIIEQLRNQFETTTIMLWRCAVATVLSLPIMLITAERIFPYSIVGWFAVVAFAIVCQVLGQGLLAYCLKQLSSGFIGITLLLEPLITAYFAWVIFAENLSIFNGVAFIIVLLGIYLAKSSSSIVKE